MSTPVTLKTIPTVTVTKAGSSVKLHQTPLMVFACTIQSVRGNSGFQYVGDSSVNSSNGAEFGPSDTVEIEAPPSPKGQFEFDLSKIYVDSTEDNAEFRVTAWIKST